MIKVIPKDGKVIIDPESGKRIPKDGKVLKNLNSFWKNRQSDGDITIKDMSKKSKKKDN